MKGPFRDHCLRYFYLRLAFQLAGCVEGIRRALVLGLVLIAGIAIEQALFVGHQGVHHDILCQILLLNQGNHVNSVISTAQY